MTSSAVSRGVPVTESPEVLAAIVHAATADPELALLVVELRNAVAEPMVRWTSTGASLLMGFSGAEMVGRSLATIVEEPRGAMFPEVFMLDRETTSAMTMRTLTGEFVACQVTAIPAPDGQRWVLHVRPARSDLEATLDSTIDALEQRFTVLADRLPLPAMLSSQGMRLGHVNEAMCALLGVSADRLLGTGWMSFVHAEDLERLTDSVLAVLTGEERDVRARFIDSRGVVRYTEVRFTPLLTTGAGEGFFATMEDRNRGQAPDEEAGAKPAHDALTGLPDRVGMWQHLTAAMQAGSGLACLVVDLDNLNQVNDTHGRKAGDALLVEVARRLAGVARPGDMVGRVGGDEFVVSCSTGSLDGALAVADRVQQVLALPVDLGGLEIYPRASIGLVQRAPGHKSADDLLRDGDVAMYRAKARGKGRIVVLDEGGRSEVLDTMTLVADLRHSIEQRRITVLYVPIVDDLGDRSELVSAEALAEWRHPERAAVAPEVLAELVEEHGLAADLGRLLLDTACAALADWQRELGPSAPPSVTVTLSATQLRDPLLAPSVKGALRKHGIKPHQLRLVVPDSEALPGLREYGVAVTTGTAPDSLRQPGLTDEDFVHWCRAAHPALQGDAR